MRSSALCAIAIAAAHLVGWCCPVFAQDSGGSAAPGANGPSPPANAESATPGVEESLPTLYYLEDKDGNLIAVPGFSWEDFREYYDLKHQIQQREQRPRFSFQHLSASGTADQDHAELTIQISVRVREEGWVRVPLHFDQTVLREPAAYQGPGEGFVHWEEGGGHIGWIRGQAAEQHELTLKALVPLSRIGNENRLNLRAPRATVSQLKLKVPEAKAEGEVPPEATLETSSNAAGGGTEFNVLWQGGDLQLTWRKPGGPTAQKPTVLTAEGTILARIDKFSADAEATLVVRGSGAPFERFHVRLPPGARLLQDISTDPALTFTPSGPEKDVIEVARLKKDTEPITLHLATRRPHSVDKPDESFELAGFEVVEAVRQSGHVAIAVAGDRQVRWRCGRGIEQIEVDQLPDALRQVGVVAGFEYFHFAQPSSLTARLVPQTTRVSVEPLYKLLVDADRVRLEAELKYAVRGGKVFQLDVGLPPGWEPGAVGPENVAAVDQVAVVDSNVLSIPLAQPLGGQITLWFHAEWPIPEESKSLRLFLPEPVVNSPGQATVVVVASDNVELIPDHGSMVGLTLHELDPQIELPRRQQAPLCFRGAAKARFAADLRVRTQSIAVEVISQISLDQQAGNVEQKLAYTIAHIPTDHLVVDVPRSLAGSSRLVFQYDGQTVPCNDLPGAEDPSGVAGAVRRRVALPETCIGACELVVRYPLQLPQFVPNRPAAFFAPLVMPGQGELLGNRLYVSAATGMEVSSSTNAWKLAQSGMLRSGGRRGLQLAAEGREEQVGLEVRVADEDQAASIVVERAWVQTWLTYSTRQDRAVFRFTSNRSELEVTLPSGTSLGQVQVLLDGKRVNGQAAGKDRLIIPLSDDSSFHRYVLELDYFFPGRRPGPGRFSIEVPHLGDDAWVRRIYWQLVLPKNEHVVARPESFVNEYAWGWDRYFWGRKPLLGQEELEAWAGVANREPVPKEAVLPIHQGANFYLFSRFGRIDRCELRTAGRTWIVLLASGTALVAGLLLIYVPASRHPAVLFGVGVVLLCVGLLYPEPALLVSQSASLGLALVLLAGLWKRSVVRRREAALPEASSAILEKGSTEVQYQLPAAGNQGSTRTAPAAEPPPAPDANA